MTPHQQALVQFLCMMGPLLLIAFGLKYNHRKVKRFFQWREIDEQTTKK